ncbi:hypothetical protein AGMMS49960_17690 [Betaproteobacteria bacterium]|nr:hypothetical protein AGMMS49543_03760 [Betaproteobacteria bacterium]GHU03388.1 hypothetical protein AGMMS49960_17690 [Betaproteobacteria bacterium]GHU17832.1 hypothetical protein AGMMS50243_06730 [Betaproteobacteria bacterium]
MNDPIEQFRSALVARDIVPPDDLLADGKLHRCDTVGKPGKQDAAYLLHLDGIPAGGFENHRDGRGWENWRADVGRALTPAEEAAHRERIEAARVAREADTARRREDAREQASLIWAEAYPCTGHDYLRNKGIAAHGHGARQHKSSLVLPLRDAAGVLHSLQMIGPDGQKRFLTGGRKRGCYFSIGKPAGVLCVAEGFATAASIFEATGYAVAVAFDAGNLLPVAQALREKLPDVQIVVCADDDHMTKENPGLKKATEAAAAVGGAVAVPDFGADRPEGATDFNDLAQARGPEAVARCIRDAHVTQRDAPVTQRDAPTTFESPFKVTDKGVFHVAPDDDGETWICSPLHIRAMTRNDKGESWGRLLEWKDGDGRAHTWAMPASMLQGDGIAVREELAHQGLAMSGGRKERALLLAYLGTKVKPRARCVDRLGWHGAVYVIPGEAIGQDGEHVVFQNAQTLDPALSSSGTVAEWRDTVGAMAAGNSRLVFAISTAFAGSLLNVAGVDSGGFHFRGGSSSGKSTSQYLAASVWGNPDTYLRSWRATSNGLEGLAALHNDGVLVLDEISQVDPHDAGEIAYMLANGSGKSRAGRTGTARQAARWRLLFLSSGEVSLTSMMAQAGKRTNAGQEIRMADIEADGGAGMGAFEDIHGHQKVNVFAESLLEIARKYHGAVGMEWLRLIVAERAALPALLADGIRQFVDEVVPRGASGQVARVARRFALVAGAGELATAFNLTGWQEGEAAAAAQKCFASWLAGFGGAGNKEAREMLAQVRAFIEAHGASRFEDMNATAEQRVINRVGFFRTENGDRQYLVLPEAFKREVCKGLDHKAVARTLLAAGWLKREDGNRSTIPVRLPGMKLTRCYIFTGRMWEDE